MYVYAYIYVCVCICACTFDTFSYKHAYTALTCIEGCIVDFNVTYIYIREKFIRDRIALCYQ